MDRQLTDNERELAKAARREYMREWRRKNRDKLKEKADRYWLRKAQEMKELAEAAGV
jgi:hypothetical protein